MRLLVLDAYPKAGREALAGAGGTLAGNLYARRIEELGANASSWVAFPADPDFAIPGGATLTDFAGLVWTGSSLSITAPEDPSVRQQLELARAAYAAGVPQFGSCWAAQIAVVAAGGTCAPSPHGREFGVARKIVLNEAGRAHALFAEKPLAFDAFTSHADEIAALPEGATCLAHNGHSPVQAVDIRCERGRFLAVQYHPEYDLHEVASLCALRAGELIELGRFHDEADARAWAARAEALHADPDRADLAYGLGVDADVLEPSLRMREVQNWLEQVLPG